MKKVLILTLFLVALGRSQDTARVMVDEYPHSRVAVRDSVVWFMGHLSYRGNLKCGHEWVYGDSSWMFVDYGFFDPRYLSEQKSYNRICRKCLRDEFWTQKAVWHYISEYLNEYQKLRKRLLGGYR